MHNKYKYGLGLLIFLVLYILFPFQSIRAQTIGIKVSPVIVDKIVDPGEILTENIKVTNSSNTAKTFYTYLRDFKAEGETGTPKLIAPGSEEGYYLASWIDITSKGIEFGPGEEKVITYQINVPANTGPGGYYGAVLFGTEPPELYQDSEDKGAGMSIAQQTASLILLQVKGDIDEEANIREFNTDKDIYGTPFDVNFLIRIENRGNVHVKPYGSINIENMFKKEVAAIRVNENGNYALPGQIRRFTTNWQGDNGFGKYTAKLGLVYGAPVDQGGQGQQTMYTEKTFWIIPWRIVVPAIISIVILGILFILFLRFYRSKAIRKALRQMGIAQPRYVKKQQGLSPALHFGLIITTLLVIAFLIGIVAYLIFFA